MAFYFVITLAEIIKNEKKYTFEQFLNEQIHEIAYRKCINEPEYQVANTKAITLMEILKGVLANDEQRKILNGLENTMYIAKLFFLSIVMVKE